MESKNMKLNLEIIDILERERRLPKEQLRWLLETKDQETLEYLRKRAEAVRQSVYGNQIYIRGLIEFTNYCKNDCYYCGIRKSNSCAERYRLSREEILSCCETGYALRFRTFVLQGGEDGYYTDERLCEIIRSIRERFPDCAITLSVGERDRKSYEKMFAAGADRYLLRHETADEDHYGKLHPKELSLAKRMECLKVLKEIGYQVGCGFMVGSRTDNRYSDKGSAVYQGIKPHMVGIGPFIPHKDTPFRKERAGNTGNDAAAALHHPSDASVGFTAGDHCPWDDRRKRAGAWDTVGGKCGDAQSITAGGKRKVPFVRQQDLYRGRGGGMPILPGKADGTHWLSGCCGQR